MTQATSAGPSSPDLRRQLCLRTTVGSWRTLMPGWGTSVRAFETAAGAVRERQPRSPWTVGVLGTERGVGVSTLTALMALTAAAWTDHPLAVLDTAAQGTTPAAALLGASAAGAVATLAAVPTDRPLSRRRLREFGSPGAAVPTFTTLRTTESWTAGTVLEHLTHRADIALMDIPWGHRELTRECWERADHIVLVTGDATAQSALALLERLSKLPGGPAERRTTVVAAARARALPLPLVSPQITSEFVPRSRALARRRLDRAPLAVLTAGLRILATAIPARTENPRPTSRTSEFEPPNSGHDRG